MLISSVYERRIELVQARARIFSSGKLALPSNPLVVHGVLVKLGNHVLEDGLVLEGVHGHVPAVAPLLEAAVVHL